jgi:hypothetical protein
MNVKIKRGRLKDLPARHQEFLREGKTYFAEDLGTGAVIRLQDKDASLEFLLDNSQLERWCESKPHKPAKEMGGIYPLIIR